MGEVCLGLITKKRRIVNVTTIKQKGDIEHEDDVQTLSESLTEYSDMNKVLLKEERTSMMPMIKGTGHA